MTDGPVFTSRLTGRQLLDSDGLAIGRVRDVVILPTAGGEPPWVLGLVVTLQRRQIFVNLGRVAEISVDGAHLRGGTVDLRRFSRADRGDPGLGAVRPGRGRPGGCMDVGIARSEQPPRRLGGHRPGRSRAGAAGLRRHTTTVVPWDKHPELFKAGELAEQLIQLREMHPTDLANAVDGHAADAAATSWPRRCRTRSWPTCWRRCPSRTRSGCWPGSALERTADVVEEMEPDDAADLLAEMPAEQRERLLAAMETVQAADLRRLLRYDATTAGGLMTSQPLIVAARRARGRGAGPDPRPRRWP